MPSQRYTEGPPAFRAASVVPLDSTRTWAFPWILSSAVPAFLESLAGGSLELEVISAEKRRRVLDVHQAHAAPHLLYRDILVFFHPALHACQHHADVLDAVLPQC